MASSYYYYMKLIELEPKTAKPNILTHSSVLLKKTSSVAISPSWGHKNSLISLITASSIDNNSSFICKIQTNSVQWFHQRQKSHQILYLCGFNFQDFLLLKCNCRVFYQCERGFHHLRWFSVKSSSLVLICWLLETQRAQACDEWNRINLMTEWNPGWL